jgi:hypothetical protein
MQVIWQYADRLGFEWAVSLHTAIDLSNALYVPREQITGSIGKRKGEEENAALNLGSTVSGHGWIVTSGCRVGKIATQSCSQASAWPGDFAHASASRRGNHAWANARDIRA